MFDVFNLIVSETFRQTNNHTKMISGVFKKDCGYTKITATNPDRSLIIKCIFENENTFNIDAFVVETSISYNENPDGFIAKVADLYPHKTITPEEFANFMKDVADPDDPEMAHELADAKMVEILESLGYEAGCKIFDTMKKWYC